MERKRKVAVAVVVVAVVYGSVKVKKMGGQMSLKNRDKQVVVVMVKEEVIPKKKKMKTMKWHYYWSHLMNRYGLEERSV